MARNGGLLRGGKARRSNGRGLLITNLGKFWVGFKKFQVILDSLGWFQMVSDWLRVVADSFGWLRVVSDGCGWFAVLLVTQS